MKDPQTNEEWKEAANMAQFLLLLDSSRMYGLVQTDIEVNVDRCDEILKAAKERGIMPDPDDLLCERFIHNEQPGNASPV